MVDDQLTLQIIIGWLVIALFTVIVIIHRTALLGFTLFSASMVFIASHSALLWSNLTGLDYGWVSPDHIVVFKYCGVGMLLFGIGVIVAWKPLRGNLKAADGREPNAISGRFSPSWLTPQFVLLCMWIGAAGYILSPITSFIPTVHAIWSIFFDWLQVGILIACLYAVMTKRYKVLVVSLGAFLPLSLIRVVSDGHAGALGFFLVHIGFVVFFARRVRLWHIGALAAVLLFLAPVANTWFQIRGYIREGSLSGNVIQRVLTFTELFAMFYRPFDFDKYRMREVIQMRFDMSDILADQVQQQPLNVPFQYGRTVTDNLLAALVPRILWPDKPVRFGGSEFIKMFTGREYGESTSVNTPVQLEFYANFGPLGAMVLLGLYGYLCARLELSLFRRDFRDLPKLLRRFVYVFVACTTGSQLTLTIMKLIPGLVGIWLAGKVIENLRKTMRFNKDFLTPLDPKKKLVKVVVTGEALVPAVAGVGAGNGGKAGGGPRPTFVVPKAREFGFRRWEGPGGRRG